MSEKELEKEAEEYTKENLCKKCHNHCREGMCTCTECKKKTFKDGAELAYSKANEWHKYSERPQEMINALCFDTEQNKFILGFYDLEADEWLMYGGYETIHIDLWKKIEVPKEDTQNDNC